MIHSTLPDLITMARALIARPSVSCTDPRIDRSNGDVIDLLAEWCEALGFTIEIQALGGNKFNLIARLGGTKHTDGLVLSGHTDTVPCDPERWTYDPFEGTVRDGRLYGLGSADMKAFFGVALAAAQQFDAKTLARPLVLLATADEESRMAGALHLARAGHALGRYAVIGEPTSLAPVRTHKGVLMEAIRIAGLAGHSSDPALGANALDAMHRLITALLAWRAELRERFHNPAFAVPEPTLNLGSIHGGDNPNRICGWCELQIDLRPLPGMDLPQLRNELRARLRAALPDDPRLRLEFTALIDGVPPFETPADAALVQLCEQLSQQPAQAAAFGTEAPFLTQLGMETVVFGPGDIARAHQPDEYVAVEALQAGTGIIKELIGRVCLR